MKLSDLENWYTTSLAARAANRSPQGIINLALEGKVRAVKVARNHTGRGPWIYEPASIAKFVEAERQGDV